MFNKLFTAVLVFIFCLGFSAPAFAAGYAVPVARHDYALPVFTGVKDMEVFLGDSVMYRKNVSASDAFGNPIDFTVDSSKVDIHKQGEYEVLYIAEDAGGNRAVEEINVRVSGVSEEALNEMVNPLLEKLVNDEMTPVEKARKIFNWINENILYVSNAEKASVYDSAYQGLKKRYGDCYTYYALSEIMLTRAGIENLMVTRTGGSSNHYWNLINPDGDGWYHFDTSPLNKNVAGQGINRFMFTAEQAEEYTGIIHDKTGKENYYTYDKTLYPEVVE